MNVGTDVGGDDNDEGADDGVEVDDADGVGRNVALMVGCDDSDDGLNVDDGAGDDDDEGEEGADDENEGADDGTVVGVDELLEVCSVVGFDDSDDGLNVDDGAGDEDDEGEEGADDENEGDDDGTVVGVDELLEVGVWVGSNKVGRDDEEGNNDDDNEGANEGSNV